MIVYLLHVIFPVKKWRFDPFIFKNQCLTLPVLPYCTDTKCNPGLGGPDLTSDAKRKPVESSTRKLNIVCHIRVLFCLTIWEHGTKLSITVVHGNQTLSRWRWPVKVLVALCCNIIKPLNFPTLPSTCILLLLLIQMLWFSYWNNGTEWDGIQNIMVVRHRPC
jgi:hypothetical protein